MRDKFKTMYKLRHFSFLIASVLLTAACAGTKQKARKGNAQCFESFYINDSTMQYFIKPITFNSNDKQIIIDFTFRKSGNTFSKVTTNFTYLTEAKADLTNLYIACDSVTYKADNKKPLYKERNKKTIKYRYSTIFDYEAIRQSFLCGNLYLIVNSDIIFSPTRRSVKRIEKLNTYIFDFL